MSKKLLRYSPKPYTSSKRNILIVEYHQIICVTNALKKQNATYYLPKRIDFRNTKKYTILTYFNGYMMLKWRLWNDENIRLT